MANPAKIERVPVGNLTDSAVEQVGTMLSRAVRHPLTRGMLLDRHLPGVIVRHEDPETSIANVARARSKMQRLEMMASVLMHDDVCIGMDSRMPDLPLRRPKNSLFGLMPAKITRGSDVLAQDVPMRGPNVQAWLTADFMTVENLSPIYRQLAFLGGEGSWTLEPGDQDSVAAQAILAGGLRFWDLPARYDDNKAGGIPPVSTLYAYTPNAGVEGNS